MSGADGTEIFQMSGNPPKDRLKKDKDDYWLVHPQTGAVHYHYTLTSQ